MIGGGHEGSEKKGLLPDHPKMTPDSFVKDDTGASKGIVYQYHGSMYHGYLPSHPKHKSWLDHPKRWANEAYEETLVKSRRYLAAGYRVFHIWGHEFTEECERARAPRSVGEICREFFG
ncbi:hypothetical protein N9S81_00555 [bacterium]|nr:hypothetical protein [bacterium]